MIVYLDKDFNPVEKDKAIMAKVIPDNGDPPYFVEIENNHTEQIREKT